MRFFPNVSIVDSAESKVIGEVTYISENALTVTFSHSFSGKAYLS
jgi:FKBP-type peptidyl-prolyl cis-trans isomerase 2